MTSEMDIDRQRERWRRWREHLKLVDFDPDFGERPPLPVEGDLRCRILFSPCDPANMHITFDDDFWSWWSGDLSDPAVPSRETSWGSVSTPTTDAAVRTASNPWNEQERYIALYRNGALEAGLMYEAAWRARDDTDVFNMRGILGRYWAAADVYSEVIDRFSLHGPFEIAVAVIKTAGAFLSGFAEGWREPFSAGYSGFRPCTESHLLFLRQVEQFPNDRDASRESVIELGMWLNDSWGISQRTFIARAGDNAGDFDWRGYGWS